MAAVLCAAPGGASAAPFTVNSSLDTPGTTCVGTCTLRQAIGGANLASTADTISFSGPLTISPTTALPTIAFPTTISGGGTVEIDGASAGPAAGGLRLSSGAASSIISGDFTATSGTLSFAPGETQKTIAVPVADDRAAEGDELLTVALSSADRAGLGQPASATVRIAGNDREPDSDVAAVRSPVRAAALRRLTGTASDPDGDLARVEVAIVSGRAGARAARGRCLNLAPGSRVQTTRPDGRSRCLPRTFLRASGSARWSLRLPKGLPRGTWVIVSRAVDRAGHREASFTARDRNRIVVTVR